MCDIYRGKCSWGEEYVGEIERIVDKRWSEHNNPKEKTEPARHLSSNISHLFAWEILMPAPKTNELVRTWKCFLLHFKRPSSNEQVKSNVLHLFLERNHMKGVFNDFNDLLLYFFFDFIGILVYYCVNNFFLTYLYSIDD